MDNQRFSYSHSQRLCWLAGGRGGWPGLRALGVLPHGSQTCSLVSVVPFLLGTVGWG